MSDNWIIIIPEAPDHVPSEDAQDRAVALFRSFAPDADEIKKEVSEAIRFIDCGGNFSRIVCPHCGKEVDQGWWDGAMDEEYAAGLTYDWPQGFARFSLEAMNAGIGDLSPEHLAMFETALGCRVRKVLQHL